jgi:hypothetical protein
MSSSNLVKCVNCNYINECEGCLCHEQSIECKVLKSDYEDHISWCRKCNKETVEVIIKRIKEGSK